jgi:hypothetical protein
LPQHPPVNDDPIQETAPPGTTYKTVTSRMVEDLGKRVVGGQPLKPEDLKGWGPQATRTLSRWLGVEVGMDITNAGNLLSRARSSNLSSEQVEEEAKKQISNAKMRDDFIKNYHRGMSSQELTALSQMLNDDQRAFDQNNGKVIGDRMSAIGSPPVLVNVSASAFKAGDNSVTSDKSNGNYKYADVTSDMAMKVANDLLMGRRDQVKGAITGWGVDGLAKPFAEWRGHLWPEDLNKASAALTAIGTPEYADQLKKIQSPELKALVEKGNSDFNNGKSRNDIAHDFDMGQKQIYGATITVQNDALGVVRAREAQFLAQKQNGQGKSADPIVPAPISAAPSAAAPGSDIAKVAQTFAHEPYSKWPTLNGWTVENIAKLQIKANDQIRRDRDEALGIAMDAVDNRKRIDDIQNPVMKTIVDRDIAVGQPYEVIAKHIQDAAKSQTAAVNDRIQNTTPGVSPPPQKLSSPGGPGGA